ncbi:MAG TPA: branched-chain amino acid ABC transporter substrate-binding protein [Actinopolymorphaceae bacterium]
MHSPLDPSGSRPTSRRTALRVGAVVAAAALAMSACGSRGSDTGTGSGTTAKIAKIGVIAPLSGDLSALGLGIQNSVDLAVKQANASNAIPGWTLQIDPQDDQASPDTGKNAASALSSDADVVGVVGTLNSSVAQTVAPVLASAKIVQVSPANTNPSLTQGPDFATAPKRVYDTYFRTCTTDSIQGPFAARYVYDTLKITKVATLHDKKTYGQGLVAAFTEEYKKLGGTVTAAETINPDDRNFSSIITKLKRGGPELLYYGGEFPQSGPLSLQMKQSTLKIPLMGGDGMYSADYIKLAGGKPGTGDYATSVGAPTDSLASAKKFVTDYAAAGYKEPYEAYGAYSYDAANAIIEALKVSLKSATSASDARQATVDAMKGVSFDGVTGKVAFDEFGDTTTKVLTVYKDTGTDWAPAKTDTFK